MSALKCPQCGGDLTPDHNNPGKMLCYSCKKRMDEDKVRQYWGQFSQPREQQAQPETAVVAQPTMPVQQPIMPTGSSPYQPQQPYQEHPQYGGTPSQPMMPEQPQQPYDGMAANNQQQATFDAAAFTNPSAYTVPPGFDSLPTDHAARPVTFSAKKFNLGQFFPSFKNLFTTPQQVKIDAAQQGGIAMGWFSALVKILLYIMAVGLVISGVYTILVPFLPSMDSYLYRLYPAMTVMSVIDGIVMVGFAVGALFMRKELGDFIRGSWMKFIIFLIAYIAWDIVYAIVYNLVLGYTLFAFLGIGFIFSVALQAVIIGLNWVYFKKREPLFTAEYPEVQPMAQQYPHQQYPQQGQQPPYGQQMPQQGQQPQQFQGGQVQYPQQQPQQPYNPNNGYRP